MNIQRASQGTLRVTITNSILNESNCSSPDVASNSPRNAHFTPCRRVGLSRKRPQTGSLNKSAVKHDEPSATPSSQPVQHSRGKSSVNECTTPMRAYSDEEDNVKLNESPYDSENETKYSQTTSFKSQNESVKIAKKRNKSKTQDVSDSTVQSDKEEREENRQEVPEQKKRKREPNIVNNSEHTGNLLTHSTNIETSDHNTGISSIQIENVVSGIDADMSANEENDTQSAVTQSPVKTISITVKQKLHRNEWSTSTKVHLSQNASEADSDDDLDFSPKSNKPNKEKPVHNNKVKRFSPKPGPSRPNTEPKRPVIPVIDSDSDDDFVLRPHNVKPEFKPLKHEQSSQSSTKEENSSQSPSTPKPRVKKVKKKSDEDELNRTEQICIADKKRYTIIHKGNIVSYVRSHDIDVDLKTAENYDNQLMDMPVVPYEQQRSMIIERKSYVPEKPKPCPPPEHVFDLTADSSMFELALVAKGVCNPSFSLAPSHTNTQATPVAHNNTIISRSRLSLGRAAGAAVVQVGDAPTQGAATSKPPSQPERPPAAVTQLPALPIITKVTSIQMEADMKPVEKASTPAIHESTKHQKPSAEPATNDIMEISKLKKKYAALESRVKAKQQKVESLKRVSIYKKNHDLEELHAVTLQFREGAQKSLLDLIELVKSYGQECELKTILHNLSIPCELVGYNATEDQFV